MRPTGVCITMAARVISSNGASKSITEAIDMSTLTWLGQSRQLQFSIGEAAPFEMLRERIPLIRGVSHAKFCGCSFIETTRLEELSPHLGWARLLELLLIKESCKTIRFE